MIILDLKTLATPWRFFSHYPVIAILFFFKAIKLNNKTISAYLLYTTIDTICNINIIAKFKNERNQSRNIEKFGVENYKSELDLWNNFDERAKSLREKKIVKKSQVFWNREKTNQFAN